MTDAEKELRRLAEYVRDHPGRSIRLAVACSSSVVLALLDRIDALEKQVGEAERKGAENAATLIASLPERLGHKQVSYRAAIIDADTWIRTMLVDAP